MSRMWITIFARDCLPEQSKRRCFIFVRAFWGWMTNVCVSYKKQTKNPEYNSYERKRQLEYARLNNMGNSGFWKGLYREEWGAVGRRTCKKKKRKYKNCRTLWLLVQNDSKHNRKWKWKWAGKTMAGVHGAEEPSARDASADVPDSGDCR